MKIIISILLLILSAFVIFTTFDYKDNRIDIARSIICERALEYNKLEVFEKQNNEISNRNLTFKDFKFVELKRKIIAGEIADDIAQTEIEKLLASQDKALLYVLLSIKHIDKKSVENFNYFIKLAYMYISLAHPVKSEVRCLEIIDRLLSVDSAVAQETAVDFLCKLNYSHDKVLRIYMAMAKPFSAKKLTTLIKNKKYLYNIKAGSIIPNLKRHSKEYIEKFFIYGAIEFSMTWKIKKWKDYNLPFLAYIYYLGGDIDMYKYYRDKSISIEQQQKMKAGYFEYVEYATKVFCLAGDIEASVVLLNTLSHGHKRNHILQRVVRYLTMTEESFVITYSNFFQ